MEREHRFTVGPEKIEKSISHWKFPWFRLLRLLIFNGIEGHDTEQMMDQIKLLIMLKRE